jgi:GAF domain-containing protein
VGLHQPNIGEVVAEVLAAVETLARALHIEDARLEPTLEAIITSAAAIHPGARDAGLILLVRGRLTPQAVTGRAPHDLDLKQQETGQGPCVEAASIQQVIVVDDTRDDVRWPRFCAAAQACGVSSMLCVPLWAGDRRLGALSLYADQPNAFNERDVRLIELFAALAALALAEAQQAEQLRAAIASRDLIGQAKGILMERFHLDSEAAFRALVRVSQDLNLKLSALARHLTETGELPGPPAQPTPVRKPARPPRSGGRSSCPG